MSDFSVMLENYFCRHLPIERGCSVNTIKTYRDTFVELLGYLDSEERIRPTKIKMEAFNYNRINAFLDWLETEKSVSASTRNNRLAAIKSFFRYVSFHDPSHLNRCSSILAIKAKKTETKPINYLTIEALELLYKSFNLDDPEELRDFCIISLLYESGARVSELINVRRNEIRLDSPCTMILHGKGKKSRIVPIDKSVAGFLKKYIKKHKIQSDGYLFTNRRKDPLTRKGVDYIVKKHFFIAKENNPDIFPDSLSPHCLRHSRAMHLLENGVNLIYIRDLLGHSSVTTTEIYSKANPEIKRKYIEAATETIIGNEDYSDEKQDELLTWLKETF